MSRLALLLGAATLGGCGPEGLSTPELAADGEESLSTARQQLSYGDHTYVIFTTARTWTDAAHVCSDMDMGLVTLDDAAEEQWLRSQIGTSASEWWIGINDRGIEGTWAWSGAASSYTHWNAGEPNAATASEDCGVVTAAGGWNDLPCTLTRAFVCESIPPKPAQYNGHDYLFFTQMKTWSQARNACLSRGLDLVTINDSAEDAWLKTQVPALLPSWIGLNDQAQEGTWSWAEGSPVTYTNWRLYEPNNSAGNEDCAVNNVSNAGSAPGGGWNDIPCTEYSSFICERVSPPEGYEALFYTATLTASANEATMDLEFPLEAGQVLEIGTCGMPTAYATGDTFLRLMGPDGLEVTANDDDCKGSGSRIRFRVPPCGGGTYVLKAGCYENTSCDGRLVFRALPRPEEPQP